MTPRQFRGYLERTPLARQHPIALGRGRGAYRFIPQVGVIVLRQARAHTPWRLDSWFVTLDDILRSDEWHAAVRGVADQLATGMRSRGGDVVERAALSAPQRARMSDPHERPAISPGPLSRQRPQRARMSDLHERSMAAIERHGLAPCVQVEDIIVDRFEDDDDAVVLVGRAQRPFLMPRSRLVEAGVTREKGRLLIQDGPVPASLALEPGVDPRIFAATSYDTFRPPATDAVAENNRGIVLLIRYGSTPRRMCIDKLLVTTRSG